MAEANFDIDPIPYDANTPELDLDVEMEDSGYERGEANFMADIEVLDALYLREMIESNNQKIQENTSCVILDEKVLRVRSCFPRHQ